MTYVGGFADGSHGGLWSSPTAIGTRLRVVTGSASTTASTAWPANNDAYAVPFLVSTSVTFTGAYFISGTSPGTTTFDVGVYRDDFSLVASLGSTAAVNTSSVVQPVAGGAFATPVTLPRGRYYLAMSSAATTLTVIGHSTAVTNQLCRLLGMFKMATAHPLPTTFVPASMGATAFIPLCGLMTATGVVL